MPASAAALTARFTAASFASGQNSGRITSLVSLLKSKSRSARIARRLPGAAPFGFIATVSRSRAGSLHPESAAYRRRNSSRPTAESRKTASGLSVSRIVSQNSRRSALSRLAGRKYFPEIEAVNSPNRKSGESEAANSASRISAVTGRPVAGARSSGRVKRSAGALSTSTAISCAESVTLRFSAVRRGGNAASRAERSGKLSPILKTSPRSGTGLSQQTKRVCPGRARRSGRPST